MVKFKFFFAIYIIALHGCSIKVDKIKSPEDSLNPLDEISSLALILVDTNGQEIIDDPEIYANFVNYVLIVSNFAPGIQCYPWFRTAFINNGPENDY